MNAEEKLEAIFTTFQESIEVWGMDPLEIEKVDDGTIYTQMIRSQDVYSFRVPEEDDDMGTFRLELVKASIKEIMSDLAVENPCMVTVEDYEKWWFRVEIIAINA